MKENKTKIGEILVEAGIIDKIQLITALGKQKQWGGKLCSIIISMGFADEEAISSALGKQFKHKCISLDDIEIPPDILNLVSLETARKYNIIPVELNNKVLTIAVPDPLNLNTIDELRFRLGIKIEPLLAVDSSIKNAIDYHYEGIPRKELKFKVKTSNGPLDIAMLKAGSDTPSYKVPEMVLHKKEDGISPGEMVNALARILIEKGLITKEELMSKIIKKS